MHITKVELENIKSHALLVKEFERGTTAITGTNGAGKTTILEAVAWTLFDLLDYKKDDFVRRGQKKGIARVTFESSLDERKYTVYRDTGTGYYVFDPQIKARIADKKDEVTLFLRQHLGVEAGTDLEALFRRAIGVPQGTFTAIFLESATERKKAFDKLLKVEEYRQGAEKLRETARYIETQKIIVGEKIARAEGELARYELLETELKEISANIIELEKILAELKTEIEAKSKSVADFNAVAAQIENLRKNHEKLKYELEAGERDKIRIESEYERAKTAAEKIKSVESAHKNHLAALAELAKLEGERAEQTKIQKQNAELESKTINAKAESARIGDFLQKAQESAREILALEPKIKEQEILEKQRETLRNELAEAKSIKNQIENRERERQERIKIYKENRKLIEETEAKTVFVANLQPLVLRDAEIVQNLAELRAKLKADEDFQKTVKNGFCPILSERCLNLKPGQTLESFVNSKFSENKNLIEMLETEHRKVSEELKTAREAERYVTALDGYKKREKDIVEEGQRFKSEIESLQRLAENSPNLEKEASEIERKLRELDNPRERVAALKKEAARESDWRDKQREIEKNLESLEKERKILAEKLEKYAEVETLFRKFQTARDETLAAHREFLANEALANSFAARKQDLAEITQKLEKVKNDVYLAAQELSKVESEYDRERHQNEEIALIAAQNRETELKTRYHLAKEREASLNAEIERLTKIREEMKAEFQEKDRLEKIYEATRFIRDTLKEAAPRVARNYVFHISNEANQLFREISGNAERTLKWTEDYGIELEESGYSRPFLNLSGGEQMAAALAVRLAILKQLSDVRIAFFDEPTTNMDLQRRERLAEQISHITEKRSFDQLFVISHDDTFEGYVDNVISIEAGKAQ